MLFYIFTIFPLILNAFLLFGITFDIKLHLTIGLVFSFLLFLFFLIRNRQLNGSIIYFAFTYWLLATFVFNHASNLILTENVLSLFINIVAAVILFSLIIISKQKWSEISPLQQLLSGNSFLAAIMYFTGLSLSYFMFIYLCSTLLFVLIIFIFEPRLPKQNYLSIITIYIFTYLIFFCNEWAQDHNYNSFSWLQNYKLAYALNSLFSLFYYFVPQFEAAPPQTLFNVAESTTSNCMAMWKKGSKPAFYSPRPTASLTSLIEPPNKKCSSVDNIISSNSTVAPSLWTRFSAFIFPPEISKSTKEAGNLEVTELLEKERKTTPLNNTSHPFIPNTISYPYSSVSVSPQLELNHTFIRSYSTCTKIAFDYELKAEFSVFLDLNNLVSQIDNTKTDKLLYSFLEQKKIPILKGTPGGHNTALIIDLHPEYDFLVLFTTAKNIVSEDSTYNSLAKEEFFAKGHKKGRVQTLKISKKLLWENEKAVTPQQNQDIIKTQNISPTFFVIPKYLRSDFLLIGERKDPQGCDKVFELWPELKPRLIELVERSREADNPRCIKIAILDKMN